MGSRIGNGVAVERHRQQNTPLWADPVGTQRAEQVPSQSEPEMIVIQDSHNINVTQAESQQLTLAQAAVEGALQGLIMLSRKHELSAETGALQDIVQGLRQRSVERLKIVNSSEVNITQSEVHLETMAQQALELLTQIITKL